LAETDLRGRIIEAGTALPGPAGLWFRKRLQARRAPEAQAAFDAALARLGPGDICLDLGANVGSFTERMADTGATVHAFEPDAAAFEALSARLAGRDNVVLHQAAIGAEDGTAVLNRAKRYDAEPLRKSVGSSIVRSGRRWMDPAFSEEVRVIGLFGYLDGLPRAAAIVKMDIEGAEWPILEAIAAGRGAGRFDALFVETHERFAPWRLMPVLRRLSRHAARTRHPYINLHWE
jgi:FkbM family methyltransferase